MNVRVVLADDQRIVREGLGMLLGLLPNVQLVATAEDGEQAVERVAEHLPDIVLMDLRMPHMDGIEATRRIRASHPRVRVIALTTYADEQSVLGALRAGASGYLTKDAGADEIRQAIAAVSTGHMLLDPAAQAHVTDSLRTSSSENARNDRAGDMPPDGLTRREAEILNLMAQGLSNAEIAVRAYVSEATVKTHVNRIFAKIGARDRAQAVAYAFRTGLASH